MTHAMVTMMTDLVEVDGEGTIMMTMDMDLAVVGVEDTMTMTCLPAMEDGRRLDTTRELAPNHLGEKME